ncbi:MAG: hypothetical protein IPJ65_27885 [Archangiaceae bacterium]|nr:hypothetical protein [Archangiaceae bacterium]
MTLVLLVALSAVVVDVPPSDLPVDPDALAPGLEAPVRPSPDARSRDTAMMGLATAAIAAALAVAIPFSESRPGSTPVPPILGTGAFVLVAAVRPVVFFAGQPARTPPTALNHTLRVIGTLTAVLGLASFISGFALRPARPEGSNWAMAGAAGLEALSALSFSIDALLGLRD